MSALADRARGNSELDHRLIAFMHRVEALPARQWALLFQQRYCAWWNRAHAEGDE